ncbi:unnamed protein product [Pleuronectes platessa]|uniref:Uncharacterized protein n=1 Tax=Pleuronectes platessa TaxID=8262 RepID=A0A9N7VMG8_PLEPL|nr:unnamed protein product [Pleuronectes platessa]
MTSTPPHLLTKRRKRITPDGNTRGHGVCSEKNQSDAGATLSVRDVQRLRLCDSHHLDSLQPNTRNRLCAIGQVQEHVVSLLQT